LAIVVGPCHSSEARGAVGGLVYNTYRGRSYVKANVAPSTQYSDAQVERRAIMSPVVALWSTITDQQRDAWRVFANAHLFDDWTGTQKRLSGFNWFCKVNYRLNLVGWGLRSDPPDAVTALSLLNPFITNYAGAAVLEWQPAAGPPDPSWFVWLWLSERHSAGCHPSIKLCKLLTWDYENTGGIGINDLLPGYYTAYSILISDQGITMPPVRWLLEPT